MEKSKYDTPRVKIYEMEENVNILAGTGTTPELGPTVNPFTPGDEEELDGE